METFEFRRDILVKLEQWRNSPLRKPLVLRGARQVGKTTVVNQFAQGFDNYLYLNLEDNMVASLFRAGGSIEDLIVNLFAIKGLRRKEGSTLVFIDEIQNCPEAMAMLRYFYEQRPDLHVIAAGSLLERLLGAHISFPVGRVEYLAMRPCSFREFLVAIGESALRQRMEDSPSASIGLHSRLISLFNRYTMLGGMPEILRAYTMTGDIVGLTPLYTALIEGYKDDSEKYAETRTAREVIRHILSVGWSKAGETVTLTRFADSNYRAREVAESFRMLEKAMLLELSFPTKSCCLPALPDRSRSPKLFWLDCGLVNFAAGIGQEVLMAKDVLDVWRGRYAEQVVAQELLAIDNDIDSRRLFWVRDKKGATAEVDFIYRLHSTLIPIEVKAGHNSHLRSLHSYVDASENCKVAVRIWSEPLSYNEVSTPHGHSFTLINLPFYLIGQLPEIVGQYVINAGTSTSE